MLCRLFLTSLVLITVTSTIAAETLRTIGTGSGSALMKNLVLAYPAKYPETAVELIQPPLSSSGGLRAQASGRFPLAKNLYLNTRLQQDLAIINFFEFPQLRSHAQVIAAAGLSA